MAIINENGFIEVLDKNEIFVFGSNEVGVHGAGAAKQALNFGAKMGKGIGLQGNTYAIPTKDKKIQTLPISEIKKYVNGFIEVARERIDLIFLVTPIGCGLAGYEYKQIAPLFKECVEMENVHLCSQFCIELGIR